MSLAMTENTSRPSIIDSASFRLDHDAPNVMTTASTKRYLQQQVRNGVQHEQQVADFTRQTRHQLASTDAEIRLMRRQLQKLEEAKLLDSVVSKFINNDATADVKPKKRPQRKISREFEDIKMDTVTGKLIQATPGRLHGMSHVTEEDVTWLGHPEAIQSSRRPLKRGSLTNSKLDIDPARLAQLQAIAASKASAGALAASSSRTTDSRDVSALDTPTPTPIQRTASLQPNSTAYTALAALKTSDMQRSNSFSSQQGLLSAARKKAAQLSSITRTEGSSRSGSFSTTK